MEISGGQPSSTSHHTQATSSSVIVQSNQPEEGVSLTSLSDIHHLHQHHQQQTPTGALAAAAAATIVSSGAATGIGSGSISSLAPHSGSHTKLHSLHQQSHLHAHHHHQAPVHFGVTRTPSAIQQQASSSSASSPILSPPGKTLGRNNNGTSKFQTIEFLLVFLSEFIVKFE